MDRVYGGDLTGGTHTDRVVALAGALAEAGFVTLHASATSAPVHRLEARSTDLPGLLADPGRGLVLTGRDLTEISVFPGSIGWVTMDRALHEALVRADTSLG